MESMRVFEDESGREWTATAVEEETPRHHGRWHLIFHPVDAPDRIFPMPEVRWQSRKTAERTLKTMSAVELNRRLRTVRARSGEETEPSWKRPLRARDRATRDDDDTEEDA